MDLKNKKHKMKTIAETYTELTNEQQFIINFLIQDYSQYKIYETINSENIEDIIFNKEYLTRLKINQIVELIYDQTLINLNKRQINEINTKCQDFFIKWYFLSIYRNDRKM